jgi:hypothetical protein
LFASASQCFQPERPVGKSGKLLPQRHLTSTTFLPAQSAAEGLRKDLPVHPPGADINPDTGNATASALDVPTHLADTRLCGV